MVSLNSLEKKSNEVKGFFGLESLGTAAGRGFDILIFC